MAPWPAARPYSIVGEKRKGRLGMGSCQLDVAAVVDYMAERQDKLQEI
jgi:hypothetical protein